MVKIRIYVLADDYRWHIMTDSMEKFRHHLMNYADLMLTTQKENHWTIMNLFMDQEEYEVTLKNFKGSQIPKSHLKLIDDN